MRGPSIRRAAVLLAAAVFAAVVISQSWAGNPITGATITSATVSALSLGAIYALAASGLVVTYTTTGIFNFAQGAIGMVMAHIFWQCTQSWGWPQLPSVLLVVLVIAPAFGVLLYVVLMRHLVGADLVVQIMATIGLMVGLMGLAAFVWDPQDFRQIPYFFEGEGFRVGETFVLWHRAIAVIVGVVVAVGLRVFLRRTQTGLAMRAVVDDPDLAALHAAPPARVSALAWAISASLGATAGLLLAPEVQLSIEGLTLLIVDAFAAAILGRLRSLPLTVAGGVFLGALNAFALGFLQFTGRWTNFVSAIPTIVLFFALLAMPAARIQVGRARARLHARVPRIWEAMLGSILFVVVVALVGSQLTLTNQNRLTVAVISVLLLVSLVPLIGWAGQVALAPLAFAGIGAYAMVEWAPTGSFAGLAFGALLAIPFGVLMALPALRLRGLYFALASIAFARGMELLFFTQPEVFGDVSAGSHVARPDVLGLDMADQFTFLMATAVLFSIVAIGLVALRRSRYGRRLLALRDSEAATTTVGLDVRIIKLAVFSLSAMLGAVAGALLAIQRGTPSAGDFTTFAGLALTLFVVVGGVALVTGALFGGILQFVLGLVAIEYASRFTRLLEAAGPAFAAIGLARNPFGAAGALGANLSKLLPWRRDAAPVGAVTTSKRAPGMSGRGTAPPSVSTATVALPARERKADVATLEVDSVSVRFGGIQALDGVSLAVEPGAVVGLIGPNGAGKTTLFNVVTGLQPPVGGHVRLDGRDITRLPGHARARRGIARTFQRLEVFGSLTARENLLVAAEMHHAKQGATNPAARVDEVLEVVGLQHVADEPVDRLPTGLARMVELARAMSTKPRVVLLDECSSGLTDAETAHVSRVIQRLAADGVGVLLVEHDMSFVMTTCTTLHVLDFGRLIASGPPSEIQANEEVRAAYLGEQKARTNDRTPPRSPSADATPAVELRAVSAGYGELDVIHDVDFLVGRGCVTALLGPNGAGKSTTLKVISGLIQPTGGEVFVDGAPTRGQRPEKLAKAGLCTIPEGRGVFPNLTVDDNLRMSRFTGASIAAIRERAFAQFPQLAPRRSQLAGTLSGGEQQMLAMARALVSEPSVLMIDELSMGLAPIVVENLYAVVARVAAEFEMSILIVEQFAHEVLGVASMAAVMVHGRVALAGTASEIAAVVSDAYLASSAEQLMPSSAQ